MVGCHAQEDIVQSLLSRLPITDVIPWLVPVGLSVRLFGMSLTPRAFAELSWREVRGYARWMGIGSFHFVAFSAIVIAIALTLQCVNELKKYQAEDLAGAAIAIGLLRELGPLTISIAWCARVTALVSEEARSMKAHYSSEREFAEGFVLPRFLAALIASVPLGAYGLLIGFITAGLFGPTIGVSSVTNFVESARAAITDRDIIVYFTKLIAINPTIAIFAGCACGLLAQRSDEPVAANAVTATFLACLMLNLAISIAAFW